MLSGWSGSVPLRDRSWRMQMRIVRQSLAVVLAALLMAPAAQAQAMAAVERELERRVPGLV